MTISDKIKISKNIAIIAGIFSIAVALLLLLNYMQISKNDPTDSKVIAALVERLKQDPNNDELKSEIRNFDLLARKAYFNSQWQVKTGAYLLLFGAIVLAISLRFYYSLKTRIEEPENVVENEITGRILAQKGIIIVGAVVLILAFVASFMTVDYLNDFNAGKVDTGNTSLAENDGIQVIDIGENPSSADANKQSESSQNNKQQVPETVAAGESNTTNLVIKGQGNETGNFSPDAFLKEIQKNHNSFRGPLSQGVSYATNIPTKWDGETGENILWKSPIPKKGLNSPIIWENKIFIAGADGKLEEVYCFDRTDGKLIWTGEVDNIPGSPASPPSVSEDTGLSAPTMTTDGKRVFAIFATGDIIAFDLDGNRIWAKNLGVPDNYYGHSSSLITWANKLIIQYDTSKGGKVMALNVATGDVVWETVRNAKISWSSPILAEADGKYQVILTADPIVAGYDVETGKELWSVDCLTGEVGPSAAYSDDIVVAANEYARMIAFDIKTRKTLWENDEYLPEASSPVAHNGLLFVATSYGVLVCYDLKTGEKYWEHDVGTTLYSSPTFADGKLFMMDNEGVMRVYQFGKEMKLISENKLSETAGTTPAYANGHIYIRGENNLYCIGK